MKVRLLEKLETSILTYKNDESCNMDCKNDESCNMNCKNEEHPTD